jgi:hypothetical protein
MGAVAAAIVDLHAMLVYFLRKLGLAEMTVLLDCGLKWYVALMTQQWVILA